MFHLKSLQDHFQTPYGSEHFNPKNFPCHICFPELQRHGTWLVILFLFRRAPYGMAQEEDPPKKSSLG